VGVFRKEALVFVSDPFIADYYTLFTTNRSEIPPKTLEAN